MNKTVIFVLGLIGSILGIIGSFIWLFFGSLFMGGVISGFMNPELPVDSPLSDGAMKIAITIAVVQSILTIAMFIITLIKSTHGSLNKGVKNSGVWLLILGITSAVINIFHFLPCILIIIAGAMALSQAKDENRMSEVAHESNTIDA